MPSIIGHCRYCLIKLCFLPQGVEIVFIPSTIIRFSSSLSCASVGTERLKNLAVFLRYGRCFSSPTLHVFNLFSDIMKNTGVYTLSSDRLFFNLKPYGNCFPALLPRPVTGVSFGILNLCGFNLKRNFLCFKG